MSEALKPCPFCGSDQVFVWKRPEAIPRYFVICPECERDINGESTQQQAIAAWNRRASPSWSTECPTEEGWYAVRFLCGNARQTLVLIQRKYLAYGVSYLIVKDVLNTECKATANSLTLCQYKLTDYIECFGVLHWHKIDVPAPPEESEVTL